MTQLFLYIIGCLALGILSALQDEWTAIIICGIATFYFLNEMRKN